MKNIALTIILKNPTLGELLYILQAASVVHLNLDKQ